MAYVSINDNDQQYDVYCSYVEESELDAAELKSGPLYMCKVLVPLNGKNPVEPQKNDKFPKKTYTFDVTKCDEIFGLLVADGQILVPQGAEFPSLEQRNKRVFL